MKTHANKRASGAAWLTIDAMDGLAALWNLTDGK
jgi:hypothetical protein